VPLTDGKISVAFESKELVYLRMAVSSIGIYIHTQTYIYIHLCKHRIYLYMNIYVYVYLYAYDYIFKSVAFESKELVYLRMAVSSISIKICTYTSLNNKHIYMRIYECRYFV
jgi:hypothetical protein